MVASTNIETILPDWSCTELNQPASDYCTWAGITCNESNNITSLIIGDNSISGNHNKNMMLFDSSIFLNHTSI
jgi:hypothetical protein